MSHLQVGIQLLTGKCPLDCYKFFVSSKLNGQCSKLDTIPAGVPQGSVLGSLLFLIYINDLTNNVKCGNKLFADDTSLFTTFQNEKEAALD